MQEIALISCLIDWNLWEFRVYFVILFHKCRFTGILLFSCDFRILNVILESYGTIREDWNYWKWIKSKNSKQKDTFCWSRRRWEALHTNSRGDLAAGEIFLECPYWNLRQARRGEIHARRRRDFAVDLGFLFYLIFKLVSKLVSHIFHSENTLCNPRIINKLV